MNTNGMDDLHDRLYGLTYGDNGILIKYHNGEGLDIAQYDQLFDCLQEFKDAYRDDPFVPKKLVHLIMQIVPALYVDISLYANDEIVFEEYHELIYHLDTAILMSLNPDNSDPHINTPLKDLGLL